MKIVENFNVRLEKAMAFRGVKASDVVAATGISHSAFSQYRSGATKPKRNNLLSLSGYLAVSPSWLMGLDVPMEPFEKYGQELIIDINNQEDDMKKLRRYMEYVRLLDGTNEQVRKIVKGILEQNQTEKGGDPHDD